MDNKTITTLGAFLRIFSTQRRCAPRLLVVRVFATLNTVAQKMLGLLRQSSCSVLRVAHAGRLVLASLVPIRLFGLSS